MPGWQFLLPVGVALVFGFLSLGALAVHLWVFRPRLRVLGARRAALAVSDLVTAAIPVSLALFAILPDPQPAVFLLVVGCIAWFGIGLAPRTLIRLSGGQSLMYPHAELLWHAESAWQAVTYGDAGRAAAIAASLPPGTTEDSREYVSVWQQFAGEAGRMPVDRERAWGFAQRLRELEGKLVGSAMPHRRLAVLLLSVVALVGGVPLAVDFALTGAPCAGAEWLLLSGRLLADAGTGADTPLESTLLHPEGTLLEDRPMGIEDAAASRGYSEARAVLERYGFSAAYRRATRLDDGMQIQTDVFEFSEARGAQDWHAWINRNACQFSNETFAAPGPAIGLQLRRQTPVFHIVEQVSWVVGNRRFVISRGFVDRPPNHDMILGIGHRAVTLSRVGR